MEILISMAIVGGISLVLIATMRSGQQSWQVEQARMSVSLELRRGVDEMSRELANTRTSGGVFAILPGGTGIQFEIPQKNADRTVVLDGSGNIAWSADLVTYSLGGLGGNQIVRKQPGSADRVMANGVTALQFTQPAGTGFINISVTVQRGVKTGDFPNQGTLTTQVWVRN